MIKTVNLSVEKPHKVEYKIKLTESDKALLARLDMEHRAKLVKQPDVERKIEEDQLKEKSMTLGSVLKKEKEIRKEQKSETKQVEQATPKVVSMPNPKSKLKVS